MKLARIRSLLPLLPENAPHLCSGNSQILNRNGSGTSRLVEVEKFAKCLDDPKFGWHFIRSFCVLEQPLPEDVTDDCLRRAYNWEVNRTHDEPMTETVSMLMPQRTYKRNALEAFLLCRDISLNKISEFMDLAVEVIWLYDQLFFNVRDRINERSYIGQIVGGQTRMAEFRDDYMNERSDLVAKRVAVDQGAEWLMDLLYMQNNVKAFDKARSMENTGAIATGTSERAARYGMASPGNVMAMNNGVKILQSGLIGGAEGAGKDQMGLAQMSAGRAIFDTVVKMQAPDLEKRRSLQNIATRKFEEARSKKIGDKEEE